MPFSAIAHYLHLVIALAAVLLLSVLQAVAVAVYRFFPATALLDALFMHSSGLRAWFAFRLGGATPRARGERGASTLPTAPELIAMAGFACEEHTVTTPDGFVLTLHRIVVGAGAGAGDAGAGTQGAGRSDSVHFTPAL